MSVPSTARSIGGTVVSVSITTVEGFVVSAPNSREAGFQFAQLKGRGVVELDIGRLMLLPGTYDISAAITDHSMLQEFHHRHRALRFDVELGQPHESFGGVVALGGTWSHGQSPTT